MEVSIRTSQMTQKNVLNYIHNNLHKHFTTLLQDYHIYTNSVPSKSGTTQIAIPIPFLKFECIKLPYPPNKNMHALTVLRELSAVLNLLCNKATVPVRQFTATWVR